MNAADRLRPMLGGAAFRQIGVNPADLREVLDDLARAKAENARLVRAIADRKGALESVPPERVRVYLAAHGWTMHRSLGPPLTVFPLELWSCPQCAEAQVLLTTEPDDYAECMYRVATKCGAVEGRDTVFVLAEWLGERSER